MKTYLERELFLWKKVWWQILIFGVLSALFGEFIQNKFWAEITSKIFIVMGGIQIGYYKRIALERF